MKVEPSTLLRCKRTYQLMNNGLYLVFAHKDEVVAVHHVGRVYVTILNGTKLFRIPKLMLPVYFEEIK